MMNHVKSIILIQGSPVLRALLDSSYYKEIGGELGFQLHSTSRA